MIIKIADCRHGKFAYWPQDVFIGQSLERYGEYSEGEVDLFAKLLRPGHVVVEVGSNIGTLTVPMAKLVGDSGRVFAFEPQRLVFQQLCCNLALNDCWNVWAEPRAVGSCKGQLGVPPVNYLQDHNSGGVELVAQAAEMVEVIRLDDEPYDPHFIKIDCEGMELDVILGAQKKISRCRPAMYVENDKGEPKSAQLIQAIRSLGYDMWWHKPPLYNPNNFNGDPSNVFVNIISLNMLCIPEELKLKVSGLQSVTDELPATVH